MDYLEAEQRTTYELVFKLKKLLNTKEEALVDILTERHLLIADNHRLTTKVRELSFMLLELQGRSLETSSKINLCLPEEQFSANSKRVRGLDSEICGLRLRLMNTQAREVVIPQVQDSSRETEIWPPEHVMRMTPEQIGKILMTPFPRIDDNWGPFLK